MATMILCRARGICALPLTRSVGSATSAARSRSACAGFARTPAAASRTRRGSIAGSASTIRFVMSSSSSSSVAIGKDACPLGASAGCSQRIIRTLWSGVFCTGSLDRGTEVDRTDEIVGAAVQDVHQCHERVQIESFRCFRHQSIHLARRHLHTTLRQRAMHIRCLVHSRRGHKLPQPPLVIDDLHDSPSLDPETTRRTASSIILFLKSLLTPV